MRVNWKKLLVCIALPLGVGALAALLSGGMDTYAQYVKPPLSPPAWVFMVVWPVLYVLMGYASYLVVQAGGDNRKALAAYWAQLAVNFLWPIVYFRFGWPTGALVVLIVLWLLVLLTIRLFSDVSERAADLLIPYILWLSYAAYLNLGIILLN